MSAIIKNTEESPPSSPPPPPPPPFPHRSLSSSSSSSSSNRKVEKKGRFTIIDLAPGSPHSGTGSFGELSDNSNDSPSSTSSKKTLKNGGRHKKKMLVAHHKRQKKVEKKGRFTIIELAGSPSPKKDGRKKPLVFFEDKESIYNSQEVAVAKAEKIESSPVDPGGVINSSPNGKKSNDSSSADNSVKFQSKLNPVPSKSQMWVSAKDVAQNLRKHDAEEARRIKEQTNGTIRGVTETGHSSTSISGSCTVSSCEHTCHIPINETSSNLNSQPSSNPEKRQPEVGSNRKHLASRQKTITIPTSQYLFQQQCLQSLIEQQAKMSEYFSILEKQHDQLIIPPDLSNYTISNESSHSKPIDAIVKKLHAYADSLVKENKALLKVSTKLECDIKNRDETIENMSQINKELRNRCSRLEKKYSDEKRENQVLISKMKSLTTHENS